MAIHRRLDSFSLIFYLLLILWVKTELHQSLPPITSGFQLLRSLSANKYFCWPSRAVETLYLSWFFLVDPIISHSPWTVTTTLLPNIFGSHVKKAGPSASGTQQQFYEAGDKLMDSHCFLLFFAISSKLLKKLCQFCAAGAKSSAF